MLLTTYSRISGQDIGEEELLFTALESADRLHRDVSAAVSEDQDPAQGYGYGERYSDRNALPGSQHNQQRRRTG